MYTKSFEHASVVLEQAITIASATDRNILIHFYADWCNKCHYLEEGLAACAVQSLLNPHYVVVTLIEDGEAGENPGTWEMRRNFGGAAYGVPFIVVLDPEGNKLADSIYKEGWRGNIGCPESEAEIKAFGKILKTTAPKLQAVEREHILNFFRNAPWKRATVRG